MRIKNESSGLHDRVNPSQAFLLYILAWTVRLSHELFIKIILWWNLSGTCCVLAMFRKVYEKNWRNIYVNYMYQLCFRQKTWRFESKNEHWRIDIKTKYVTTFWFTFHLHSCYISSSSCKHLLSSECWKIFVGTLRCQINE